jgi:hypothetical protein
MDTFQDKIERIRKSYNGDPLTQYFNKGDISYAFDRMKFNKTGAELKALIATKKSKYDQKYAAMQAQMLIMRQQLAKSGYIDFKVDEYGYWRAYWKQEKSDPIGENNLSEQAAREIMYVYNDMTWDRDWETI